MMTTGLKIEAYGWQAPGFGRRALLAGIVLRRMAPGRAVLAAPLAGPPCRYRHDTPDLPDRLMATGPQRIGR